MNIAYHGLRDKDQQGGSPRIEDGAGLFEVRV